MAEIVIKGHINDPSNEEVMNWILAAEADDTDPADVCDLTN